MTSPHGSDDAEFVLAEINRRRRVDVAPRAALAIIAATQLFFAIPWLFGSSPLLGASTADLHLTRDGVLGIVFGVSGMAVAYRTRLAWFALPLVFLLLLVQTGFAFIDHRAQHVASAFELLHLLGALIGVGIAYFVRPRGVPGSRPTGLRRVK